MESTSTSPCDYEAVAGKAPVDPLQPAPFRWGMVTESLRKPYRVTMPMVVLVLLVPVYLFIPLAAHRTPHVPALSLDDRVPLQPAWVLVYGSLYLFLILLPVFVVRQDEHIRRTVYAYLTVWIAAYVCFFFYPTVAPRARLAARTQASPASSRRPTCRRP